MSIQLVMPVRGGFTADDALHRRNIRAIEAWAESPFVMSRIEGLIGTTELEDLAVTTAKIDNLAVTTGKIGPLAVTAAKIATDAVETLKIKDLNVTTGKLADLAVTDGKIANTTISAGKLNIASLSSITAALGTITTGTLNGTFTVTGTLDTDAATGLKIGGAVGDKIGFYGVGPVVQASAYTPSNRTVDRTYDCDATTLDEVADVLATLILDLQNVGLIG